MKKQVLSFLLVVVVVLLSAAQTRADNLRVLRSCVFPGMGQIGDDQKVKGLLFMAGEALLLTGTFEQAAKSNALARETEYLRIQYNYFDSTAIQHTLTHDRWESANTQSKNALLMSYGLAGASVVWWAINIADAILFAPKDDDNMSLMNNIKDNLALSTDGKQTAVSYRIQF